MNSYEKMLELHENNLLPDDLVKQVKSGSFHGIVTDEDVIPDKEKLTRRTLNRLIKRHTKWYKQPNGSPRHLLIVTGLTDLLSLI